MITVRTQIKDILKESGLGVENISGDFIDRLDEKVKLLVIEAAKRAKENGRRTIMGKDV
jgi:histone H3/H4